MNEHVIIEEYQGPLLAKVGTQADAREIAHFPSNVSLAPEHSSSQAHGWWARLFNDVDGQAQQAKHAFGRMLLLLACTVMIILTFFDGTSEQGVLSFIFVIGILAICFSPLLMVTFLPMTIIDAVRGLRNARYSRRRAFVFRLNLVTLIACLIMAVLAVWAILSLGNLMGEMEKY